MGVFIYMAYNNLFGVQFIERLVLMFIPDKYYPDKKYCQNVGRLST